MNDTKLPLVKGGSSKNSLRLNIGLMQKGEVWESTLITFFREQFSQTLPLEL